MGKTFNFVILDGAHRLAGCIATAAKLQNFTFVFTLRGAFLNFFLCAMGQE
jgi:hypothetical protein